MSGTQVDVAIAKGKSLLGSHVYDNYCQRFVRVCYEAAGITGSAASATEACAKWACSSDISAIPKGATVYFNGTNADGHVGIYLGDGNVLHAANGVKIESLTACDSKYIFRGWGFQGGVVPSGSNYTADYSANTTSKLTSLGIFETTAYCPCEICCGKNTGITASGATAKANHTIAVDPDVIPLGSQVQINGKTYMAEDTGGAIKGKKIDIFFETHEEALAYGRRDVEVYLISKGEAGTDGISYNLDKKSFDSLPVFNRAAVSKLLNIDANKGLKLYIIRDDTKYDVTDLCADKIELLTKRRASPAKLTFKIARDFANGNLTFEEGNAVALIKDNVGMFYGYIFSKSRDKEQLITVTAYDQTRYFKNKETYCYTKKASELLKMIAEDFRLQVGDITDTGYIISSRKENNVGLWDIIYNALDLTTIATGKMFILYDNFGEIVLKNYDELVLNDVVISDSGTLTDFSYKTDIDTETYNRIVLYKDNAESGKRDVYISQDSINAIRWGVLQYTEQISDNYPDGKIKDIADRMLALYNRVKKTFTVEESRGDARVRAGCSVYVKMEDVGESIGAMLLVESCTHTFENGRHYMKLELAGDF